MDIYADYISASKNMAESFSRANAAIYISGIGFHERAKLIRIATHAYKALGQMSLSFTLCRNWNCTSSEYDSRQPGMAASLREENGYGKSDSLGADVAQDSWDIRRLHRGDGGCL